MIGKIQESQLANQLNELILVTKHLHGLTVADTKI